MQQNCRLFSLTVIISNKTNRLRLHAGKRGVIELNVIFAVLFAKYSLASPLEAHLFKEKKI